jgi:hypothetical protein
MKIIRSKESENYGIADKSALYDLLRSDGSIVINKNLMRTIGVHEAIIYCELLSRNNYFETREDLTEDGYFFNTIEDLELGTCLSEYQQRRAIKKLCEFGLIETKTKGLPAKRYFKIVDDVSLITKYIAQGKETVQLRRNLRTRTEVTKELEPEKLKGNNTKLNNTQLIIQRINVVDADTYDVEFYIFLFKYFFEQYLDYYGKEHPVIKQEYITKVMDNIDTFCDDYDVNVYREWESMIDMYFKSDLNCDRNIIHFSQSNILINRASNLKIGDVNY